jgi:1-acyl-sn-glycerol-3-phosphate acyltransferase
MDAAELERYRFFSKLGFFGIEPGSRRGAVTLLRTGGAILQQPDAALWITPQGRFADPRERPVQLQPGLGRLARRAAGCTLLPLAVEYVFGEEPLPEALLMFGRPVEAAGGGKEGAEDLEPLIGERLEAAQDALGEQAQARDYADFEVILRSREGISFFYDLWRRLRAKMRGETARLGHGKDSQ